jgi:hypothetical protein
MSKRAAKPLFWPFTALVNAAATARTGIKKSVEDRVPVKLSEKAGLRAIVASERTRSAETHRELARLARGTAPILVGPWMSEVGFELLYWIPFLQWARTTFDLDPERLIIVSRGGTASWYQHVSHRYAEIFDCVTPEEFVTANDRRVEAAGGGKHMAISELDLSIAEGVKAQLGLTQAEILHPSLMYQLYMPFWRRRAPVRYVEDHSSFRRLVAPDASALGLPDEYVAVKFYFSPSFPDTKATRTFVARLLSDLAERTDVVLLNSGLRLDDHTECDPASLDRVHRIDHLMSPRTNLGVQTQVISGAKAFMGTYGGLSYMAPLYGVDSLAFYAHRHKFVGHHLDLAHRSFSALEGSSYVALDIRDRAALALLRPADPKPVPPKRPPGPSSSTATRARWVVPVRQPLVLISEIQRSGGTLMSRLFDGHPECFTHPYELHWGRPQKYDWPAPDLSAPVSALFDSLEERWVRRFTERGYYAKGPEAHPFLFDIELQRRLFEEALAAAPPARPREVLDAHFTALFNAWLDCQGIYQEPKRFVVAFTPRVNMRAVRRDAFWRDYPDGYLISIVREPVSWLASARRHKPGEYQSLDDALQLWQGSAEGTLAALAERPDRVLAFTFTDVIQRTEAVMRRICERTGLSFAPGLLRPTYNGRPVGSNSSFRSTTALDAAAIDHDAEVSADDRARVQAEVGGLYAQARERLTL